MAQKYWFKIERTKYRQPMIPIWPQGYLAFALFLLLICLAFVTSAYAHELFPSINPLISIPFGLLIGTTAFGFLIYRKHKRSEG